MVPMTETTAEYATEELLPWEMQPEESAESYRAFCDYRAMGKASLQRLHARYKSGAIDRPPTARLRTLSEWSSRFDWVARREAWVQFQEEVRAEAAVAASREMGERQAKDAARLQSAAMSVLDLLTGYDEELDKYVLDGDGYSLLDVVRLFKAGFQAERVARGEAAQIIEERGEKANRELSELSDDELRGMVDED